MSNEVTHNVQIPVFRTVSKYHLFYIPRRILSFDLHVPCRIRKCSIVWLLHYIILTFEWCNSLRNVWLLHNIILTFEWCNSLRNVWLLHYIILTFEWCSSLRNVWLLHYIILTFEWCSSLRNDRTNNEIYFSLAIVGTVVSFFIVSETLNYS